MKQGLLKNLHWIIIMYAAWGLFNLYEEKEIELNQVKNSLSSNKQKLTRSKKDLERVQKFNQDLEKSRSRVDEVVKNLEKIQRQLPAEINDTAVQSIMSSISNDLRIQNPDTSPKEEKPEGFYFSKEYVFDGRGTFLQFLILFEKLEKLSTGDEGGRILNVRYVRMIEDDKADKRSRFRILKLALTIESFRYNSNYKWKE